MTPPKQPKRRVYQQHGLHTITKALASVGDMEGWLSELGEVGQAAKVRRDNLIQDQGGKAKISEAERMTIDGTITAFVILQSVGRFIQDMPCPVDKVRRRLFNVVPQWMTIFEGLRSALKDLNELRLKRPKPEPLLLADYLGVNGTAKATKPPSTKEEPPVSDDVKGSEP